MNERKKERNAECETMEEADDLEKKEGKKLEEKEKRTK